MTKTMTQDDFQEALKVNLTWDGDNGQFEGTGNPGWQIVWDGVGSYGFFTIFRNKEWLVEIAFGTGMFSDGNGWCALITGEGYDEPEVLTSEIGFMHDGNVVFENLNEKINASLQKLNLVT